MTPDPCNNAPVKLQTKTKIKKAKTARLWSYVRDERPWQGQAPPCAWYQFSVDRKGEHPVNHLSGYTGTVHADGYAGFNGLFGENKADEQACMVHVRRKFVDVYEAQGSAVAKEVIERIADLYAVEKEARGGSAPGRGVIPTLARAEWSLARSSGEVRAGCWAAMDVLR